MIRILYLIISITFLSYARAEAHNPVDSIPPIEINITTNGAKSAFKAELPALKGIPGGRQPFYTYLWDFGDGHFSTKENPEHVYAQPGEYHVNLYVVNNYDDGPRPKRRTKSLQIDSKESSIASTSPEEESFFSSNGIFQLSKNANALPGQDMVITAGVKTTGKGKVFILTNEKIYSDDAFVYTEQSTYNNEKIYATDSLFDLKGMWASISNVLITQSGSPDYGTVEKHEFSSKQAIDYFSELHADYKTLISYDVEDNGSESQFSFINLDVTQEMLADTNAIITITGIYLPDEGDAMIHKMEVPVVTSHDPNKMSLKNSRLSYRTLSKKKELIYKVQFQNDGEGDAKNVRLEIALPKNIDPATFKLLNISPQCDTCATPSDRGCWQKQMKGDTLVFHFKDISLPGTKAEDITDQDSTKGFIRFSVQTKKKLENRRFKAQTNIFFDKNDPIKTNTATGRFKKGFSPIVFAAYNSYLSKPDIKFGNFKDNWTLGVGLAPIAPYKKIFWQVELYASASRRTQQLSKIIEEGKLLVDMPTPVGVDTDPKNSIRQRTVYYDSYQRDIESSYLQINIVPVHIRYNINRFLSAGVGLLGEVEINTSNNENRIYNIREPVMDPISLHHDKWKDNATKLLTKGFVDLNVGTVYLGPSLGLRYIYGGDRGQQLNLYTAWRF